MCRVKEIENRVKELAPQQLIVFGDWSRQFDSDRWDRQIEADVTAGVMDNLAEAGLEQHRRGESSNL